MAEIQPTSKIKIINIHDQPPADRNPALIYIAAKSAGSRRTIRDSLQIVTNLFFGTSLDADGKEHPDVTFDRFPWHDMEYQHVEAIRSRLQGEYSAATANKILTFVRQTCKRAWRLGLMGAEVYQAIASVESIPTGGLNQAEHGRYVTNGELRSVLEICNDGSSLGTRDMAIIAVAYGAGLRRGEIVNLDMTDYDPVQCHVAVVNGKRNKSRIVPLNESVCLILDRWIGIRGSDSGKIFCSIRKNDKLAGVPLTADALYKMLRRRAKEAGLTRFSAHDFRRKFISDLLDAGVTIDTASKLAGHAKIDTTAGYDRRGSRVKEEAVRQLNIPLPELKTRKDKESND